MKIIGRITALSLAVLIALTAAISAGAVTVKHDGREYTLRSETPAAGDINVLLIRLGFADYPVDNKYYPAGGEEELLAYFDGSADSVNAFYETSSYGKLRLSCDKVYSYNARYPRYEYDKTDAEYTLDELFGEAFDALKDDINFDEYDSDGDGELDIVAFDFAGPEGSWGETWWPHVYHDADVAAGDKHLSTYSLISGGARTYMHEFGHILGAADYYSYQDGNPKTIMTFDMMSGNDSDHCGFNKWLYGWLTDEDIAYVDKASGDTTVALEPIETPSAGGKKIAVVAPRFTAETPFLDEFFVVEYDSGEGNNKDVFENGGFTPGFRIFHVNAAASYDDENNTADFISDNDLYRLNLIHNVKNELDDTYSLNDEIMFYREGDELTPEGYPNTGFSTELVYNGRFTGISFTDFVTGEEPSFRVSFTDEQPEQAEPNLTLDCESLDSDIRMTLRCDAPLVSLRPADEGYEAPYMVDAEGEKLTLDIRASYGSATRFDVRYLNASPTVQPDTEYTLVIPEGFFLTGYEQKVGEFRQAVRTDRFLPLTQIDRYSERAGMRYSNTFAMTDRTYGRIEIDAAARRCDLIEFDLNGGEIGRNTFDVPAEYDSPKFLLGCRAYRLNDGDLAVQISTLDDEYFTKIDRTGNILSDTFTVSGAITGGYDDDIGNVEFDTYKDGLCKLLTDMRNDTAIIVIIDFENDPYTVDAASNESYFTLGSESYARCRFHDGRHHIHVYDEEDNETADIALENIALGIFAEDGKLELLYRDIYRDEDERTVIRVHLLTYDYEGNKLGDEDITDKADFMVMHFRYDRAIPTQSGYFLVEADMFDGSKTVTVCDKDWKKLGELSAGSSTGLSFIGECGLMNDYQYFEDEMDAAWVVLRFNIGEVEIAGERFILGDADGDGEVTILDATAIQRTLAGLPTESFIDKAADADEDGELTILDATAVQRWLAGLDSNENIGSEMLK